MSNSVCLGSLRQALYRVFVSPAAAAARGEFASKATYSTVALQRPPKSRMLHASQTRTYAKLRGFEAAAADFAATEEEGNFDKRYTTQKSFERSGKARLPIDHEITDPKIMVIDNGPPEGPLNTAFALSKIQPEESLRMVTPYVPANREKNKPQQFAICKIVNKKQEADAARDRKEKKKMEEKPKSKEMELGWGITDHDLGFKMRTVQGFLEKGWKVTITLGKKKGMASVDKARCQEVVKIVEEGIGSLGSRIKPAEGEPGRTYRMLYKGNGKPAEPVPEKEQQKKESLEGEDGPDP